MFEDHNSEAQMYNIFSYNTYRIPSSPNINITNSTEFLLNITKGSSNDNVEENIHTGQLENIQEEIVERKMEYFSPSLINYRFSQMLESSPNTSQIVASNDFTKSSNIIPTASLHRSFSNLLSTDNSRFIVTGSNTSILIKSEDLTSSFNFQMAEKQEHTGTPILTKKYSNAFLNSDITLEELHQQNILAQQLLRKYFMEENLITQSEHKPELQAPKLEELEQKPPMPTLSALVDRYFHHLDVNEQVSLKPSDEYVFLNRKDTSRSPLNKKNASVKIVKPFKYHKKNWDSGSDFNFTPKVEAPAYFEEPRRKRSRYEPAESNVAVKSSSTTSTLKTEQQQFLTLRSPILDDKENTVLYKTDSKTFEKAWSLDEFHHFLLPKGCKHIDGLNKPRYNFQTLHPQSKPQEVVMNLLDSGSHINITEEEYRRWLKENNFLKYTTLARRSVSSLSVASYSKKYVNYSVSIPSNTLKEKKSASKTVNKGNQVGITSSTSKTLSGLASSLENLVGSGYTNLYQLFLYEHIVMSNVMHFYGTYNTTRIRKFTNTDRVYQAVFLLFCSFIFTLLNNRVFSTVDNKWF